MTSPVAIFVYNRLNNTSKTIDHLSRNTLARETDVFVFSDGGKDEDSWKLVNAVRTFLRDFETSEANTFHSFTIVERSENIYLEKNIISGINQVLEQHETVIVLEDDICTSPYYLEYMNSAFELYKDEKRVMHVAGFTNLDLTENPVEGYSDEFYFTPHMSGWGWGTWRDRWQEHFVHYQTEDEALEGMDEQDRMNMQYGGVFPCLKSLKKDPIPWDICWEIAIYKSGGLCLTPAHTMVRNIGLKNGTHFRSFSMLMRYEFDREPLQRPIGLVLREPKTNPQIEDRFREAITDWGIRYTALGKIIRRILIIVRSAKVR